MTTTGRAGIRETWAGARDVCVSNLRYNFFFLSVDYTNDLLQWFYLLQWLQRGFWTGNTSIPRQRVCFFLLLLDYTDFFFLQNIYLLWWRRRLRGGWWRLGRHGQGLKTQTGLEPWVLFFFVDYTNVLLPWIYVLQLRRGGSWTGNSELRYFFFGHRLY